MRNFKPLPCLQVEGYSFKPKRLPPAMPCKMHNCAIWCRSLVCVLLQTWSFDARSVDPCGLVRECLQLS